MRAAEPLLRLAGRDTMISTLNESDPDDIRAGPLPEGSAKPMRFTGITVLRVQNGFITEELGQGDGVSVLK
jgi:hypothetical protein